MPGEPTYLKDLVADRLAARGMPGTVDIKPSRSGSRFAVDYVGDGSAHLLVDDWEICSGTIGAPVEEMLADKIAKMLHPEPAAAAAA